MYQKIINSTPFGSVGIIWSGGTDRLRVVRVLVSKPGLTAEHQACQLYPDAKGSSCREIDVLAGAIRGVLEGDEIEISLDIADLDSCSSFQQSVLRAEHRIPRGGVSTYALIAAHLGKQGGARAVGNALANNPFPIIVPCHRAVRSDRTPGDYQGGSAMKRALLEREGLPFDGQGRIACAHFFYDKPNPL
jgi:methylated-DNA-[protein]-cysteine S-methyltransferase